MSRTLATKSGSLDSLKVSNRCGCRPKARHIRCTVETDSPLARAMLRELQWVALGGFVSRVRTSPSRSDHAGSCAAAPSAGHPEGLKADARRSVAAACRPYRDR